MCPDRAAFAVVTKTSEGLVTQSFSETLRRVSGRLFPISDHGRTATSCFYAISTISGKGRPDCTRVDDGFGWFFLRPTDQIRPSRPDQTKPDQTRSDQTRSDQTRSDQTRQKKQTRPDQTCMADPKGP